MTYLIKTNFLYWYHSLQTSSEDIWIKTCKKIFGSKHANVISPQIMCHNVFFLTQWNWVIHICVNRLTIIGSDNGLSPGQHLAIIWTNVGILYLFFFLRNKLQWNFHLNSYIFIQGNTILFWSQWMCSMCDFVDVIHLSISINLGDYVCLKKGAFCTACTSLAHICPPAIHIFQRYHFYLFKISYKSW